MLSSIFYLASVKAKNWREVAGVDGGHKKHRGCSFSAVLKLHPSSSTMIFEILTADTWHFGLINNNKLSRLFTQLISCNVPPVLFQTLTVH